MNIFLTYDYELFFGESTGSVQKCIIQPTERLLELSKKHSIAMTFFVDVGYIIKLSEYAHSHHELKEDLSKIEGQLQEIISTGNDIQLHIHPHWEKSFYADGKWNCVTDNAYKLDDFSDAEIVDIVKRYKFFIDELTGSKTTTFRAGGWCIQPFNRLKEVFQELEIRYDSSVFPGGKFESTHYAFDFTNAPHKSSYRFEEDVCVENKDGYFTEFPISSYRYNPLFYWRLYAWGRINPVDHKMLGDGTFLAQPGRKKSVLTNFTWNHVSTDGFYASKLTTCLKNQLSKGSKEMVIIGHPKSMTNYSFKKLDSFLNENAQKHVFTTFNSLK